MKYEFVAGMVETCGWEWNHSYLIGVLYAETRAFLRGDITREKFTAFFACYEIARDRFYQLLDSEDDTVLAMQKLATELGEGDAVLAAAEARERRHAGVSLPLA
jgi:hypothetical protein